MEGKLHKIYILTFCWRTCSTKCIIATEEWHFACCFQWNEKLDDIFLCTNYQKFYEQLQTSSETNDATMSMCIHTTDYRLWMLFRSCQIWQLCSVVQMVEQLNTANMENILRDTMLLCFYFSIFDFFFVSSDESTILFLHRKKYSEFNLFLAA